MRASVVLTHQFGAHQPLITTGKVKFYKSAILLNVQAIFMVKWHKGVSYDTTWKETLFYEYLINFFRNSGIPDYVSTRIENSERKYAGNNKVFLEYFCWIIFSQCSHIYICSLQQRQSAVFTSSLDDTYDAYEKDIAMVSIFFKKDTVYEFKR